MLQLPPFQSVTLFQQAMTHRSYMNEYPGDGEHNERLEFLGDAVLTYIAGEFLYQRYPNYPEGTLTSMRAALVDEIQLAKFAIALDLGIHLRLGKGTEQNGGRTNSNLLSSAFEAMIGAYLLDTQSNIQAVKAYMQPLFQSAVEQLDTTPTFDNVKSRFQAWALAQFGENPVYAIAHQSGPDHDKTFTAIVSVKGQPFGTGTGKRKQDAEKQAAANALEMVLGNSNRENG